MAKTIERVKTVENQRVILVKKEKADKKHPYSIINEEAMKNAAMLLNGNEFKIWTYIAKNQDGYRFALSRAAICNWMNISSSTYTRGIKTLIDLKFLVPKEGEKNVYYFYEGGGAGGPIIEPDPMEVDLPEEKVAEINHIEFKF